MLTLHSLAIAMAGAGVLAGLSVTPAQACDNDRYPCPVVAQPQEAADAAARPQLRKKASRAARHDEKARAKAERQASQGSSQTNAAAPVAQEQAADSGSKKAGGVVPTLNDEVGRNESPVAAAAAAWLVLPDTAGAGAQGAAGEQNAAAERVAADEEATPTVPGEWGENGRPQRGQRTRPCGNARRASRFVLAQLSAGDPGRSARRGLDRTVLLGVMLRNRANARITRAAQRAYALTNVPVMFFMLADRRLGRRCRSSRPTRMPP